ncbi:MAG TPA: sulfatase-like hydrolase/transferase [Candidatus Lokiarchaeia archaeon]|nr:sulfatase-like hydrolase/transferase [Candidatus Lokiarchaeia archaeon]
MAIKSKPNVLFIMADQMRADCIEAVNPGIKTPNIQRLVDNGVLFNRAYAPSPVCLPCRASVLTGQYPSTHGAYHNECSLPQDYPSNIAREFAKTGYYTHIIGKSHFNTMHEPNSPEAAPRTFNTTFFNAWHGPWYCFEHADISIGHSTESVAPSMHYRAWLEEKGVDIPRYFGNTAYPQYGAWDLPEDCHSSTWVAETAITAFHAAHKEGRPFFAWLNFPDPHNPCMVPEPWASMYNPEAIQRHGFKAGEPASFDNKPPFYHEILSRMKGAKGKPSDLGLPGFGNVSSLPWTQRKVQENAACYYGMVSLMDKCIGTVLDDLDASDELDNTIIAFTADHGDFLGDHGMFYKSVVAFDEAMHVPLVASWLDHLPSGARSEGLHSLVDLPPTALALCGLDIPPAFEGVDQSRAWLDPAINARADVMVEERPYNTDFHVRVLINDRYKLAFYANRDYGELYDVVTDPDDVTNLWDDETFASIKGSMITRLLSMAMNARAPQPTPIGRLLERFPAASIQFKEHLLTSGTITADDQGNLRALVPFNLDASMNGQTDVPLEDIIEDYINVPLLLDVDDTQAEGMIVLDVTKRLVFTSPDETRRMLEQAFSSILGKPVIIAGFLNLKANKSPGFDARYVLYFKNIYNT